MPIFASLAASSALVTAREALPLFLLMGVGAFLRHARILEPVADRTLLDLSVRLLLPCLILDHLVANLAVRDGRNLLLAPSLGFVLTAATIGLAWLIARIGGLDSGKARRTFAFVAGINNYGYIPVPLVEALYGPTALGVLFLFNLGVESCFWLIGFSLFEGRRPWAEIGRAFTLPVRAILLGLAINLGTAGLGFRLDPASLDAVTWGTPVRMLLIMIHLLGGCAIPLALLLIGATMYEFWGQYRLNPVGRAGPLAFGLRNVLAPLLLVTAAVLLPVSRELREVIVVQAAMPAAVFPLLLVRNYGGDIPVSLQAIFATTVGAIVTLPLWIYWGFLWIGS